MVCVAMVRKTPIEIDYITAMNADGCEPMQRKQDFEIVRNNKYGKRYCKKNWIKLWPGIVVCLTCADYKHRKCSIAVSTDIQLCSLLCTTFICMACFKMGEEVKREAHTDHACFCRSFVRGDN